VQDACRSPACLSVVKPNRFVARVFGPGGTDGVCHCRAAAGACGPDFDETEARVGQGATAVGVFLSNPAQARRGFSQAHPASEVLALRPVTGPGAGQGQAQRGDRQTMPRFRVLLNAGRAAAARPYAVKCKFIRRGSGAPSDQARCHNRSLNGARTRPFVARVPRSSAKTVCVGVLRDETHIPRLVPTGRSRVVLDSAPQESDPPTSASTGHFPRRNSL